MSMILGVFRVVLLTTIFYLIVAPVGFALRLSGRNRMRHAASAGGFWVIRRDERQSRDQMRRKS